MAKRLATVQDLFGFWPELEDKLNGPGGASLSIQIETLIRIYGRRFCIDDWCESTSEAHSLLVMHRLETLGAISTKGGKVITSQSFGGLSQSFAAGAAATEDQGDLTTTSWGRLYTEIANSIFAIGLFR